MKIAPYKNNERTITASTIECTYKLNHAKSEEIKSATAN